MTWDKVMKLRNRIRIFAVIFILALGMKYLPMAVYAAEVTAEESDMANDAEPDMDETQEPDNASETDKEDKTDVQDTGQNIPVTDIEISDHEEEVEVGKTINLTATALPANATESTITFRSSDINIATVTSAGEVKGISKGYVTIYVFAGSIIKEVNLTVKVKTTGININKEYLVMKPGTAFKLSVSVFPAESEQAVSYKSTNTSVAAVSGSGVVTAKQTGSSTIIVSNGDLSGAVSVIVNRDTESSVAEPAADSTDAENTSEQTFDENTDVSETPVISEQMLYELYTAGRSMKVTGDGYSIIIDGKKIINYKNELNTDIELERAGDCIKFNLNDGEYLCGEVTLHIDDVKGKYLYLYNNVKHKYELVSIEDMSGLNLSKPVKYMITAKPIREGGTAVRYILIAGGIGIIGLDNLEEKMKKNLKILMLQFAILIVGSGILDIMFDMPKWFELVVLGLLFYLVFFIIQIKGAMKNEREKVSSDGIAGARLCGILFSAVLFVFILGIYVYQIANIIMVSSGVIILIIERKKIKDFFFKNYWESRFWMVYIGCIFIIGGVFSVFAALDMAPCTELKGIYRIIGIIVFVCVILSTLPPNTLLAKFATYNFKNWEEIYKE